MRNEIINKINDLFDENVNLKVRNAYLEAKENERNEACSCERQEKSKLNFKIIEYGRKHLTNEVLKSWGNEVSVHRDNETNDLKITSFNRWYENKINKSYVPENMSIEEVKELIYPYALEKYEEEKAEAVKKFEEKELKNKEEEENE